ALRERLLALGRRPQAAMARQLQADTQRLRALARALETVSPLATVTRGYAILTRVDDGTLVRSTAQLAPGDRLRARLADGEVTLRTE
ncbi:exodeoxyribonuclease VII large subunit, partial [Xanthomonas translucens]